MTDEHQERKSHEAQWDDFRRLWPLKLATAIWLIFATVAHLYLALATWQEWWPFPDLGIEVDDSFAVWAYVYAAGGLGATLFAGRGFYWAVGPQNADIPKYNYDPNWTWWYLLRPWFGGLLGLIGYGALRVVLTPAGVSTPDEGSETLFYAAVAFASGFSLTQVLAWLDNWARSLFRPKSGE